jgi:hypothetical protein
MKKEMLNSEQKVRKQSQVKPLRTFKSILNGESPSKSEFRSPIKKVRDEI